MRALSQGVTGTPGEAHAGGHCAGRGQVSAGPDHHWRSEFRKGKRNK